LVSFYQVKTNKGKFMTFILVWIAVGLLVALDTKTRTTLDGKEYNELKSILDILLFWIYSILFLIVRVIGWPYILYAGEIHF